MHRLLVAGGSQRQVGGKSRRLDEHLDLAAARGTLQIAENIPASLAPVAGDAVALAGDIAAQVEFVAVAGAMKVLLQTEAAAIDLVVGLAADALGRSVGQRNRPVAGPCPVETGKRSRLGWLADTDSISAAPTLAALIACPKRLEPNRFILRFPVKNDVLNQDTSRRIKVLVSPNYIRFKQVVRTTHHAARHCTGSFAKYTDRFMLANGDFARCQKGRSGSGI